MGLGQALAVSLKLDCPVRPSVRSPFVKVSPLACPVLEPLRLRSGHSPRLRPDLNGVSDPTLVVLGSSLPLKSS